MIEQQNVSKTLVPNPKALSDLQLFTMPEGGVDALSFITWDTIEVIGKGEETIEFHGSYTIERANPTSADWAEASIDITMRDLNVNGTSKLVGRVHVSTNAEMGISAGQVRTGTTYDAPNSPKMCQMYGYMKFDLLDLGVTVFNKEQIVLEHTITHVPPIGQGGGTGYVNIPLYSTIDPDGAPIAILHRVKTHIGAWLDK
ncbi:hypothetical protein KTT_56460 [Tengunoibacter tsumagoiensis]|uniref:Uncharacterized protein n=2 Tax=Tengunoibacter tsumagoiensis TaxID=2014871 RepID=A0A402A9D7_9CHLR|nr:hypothetical protein KTT_56460 [Tengunoibacter tsumagoiensis]